VAQARRRDETALRRSSRRPALFELGSEIDNESYDFNTLKNVDRTQGWTLP